MKSKKLRRGTIVLIDKEMCEVGKLYWDDYFNCEGYVLFNCKTREIIYRKKEYVERCVVEKLNE